MSAHTVVLSFGVGDIDTPDGLRAVARRIAAEHTTGRRVVAVLPAMGGATDGLRELAFAMSPAPDPRELDMLVSAGARISCALCAMVLIDDGHRAVSLTGLQAGIVTDTSHGRATVVEVRAGRVIDALADGAIVLVAGMQGVSTDHEVTTLGMRDVDATAVALARALHGTMVPVTVQQPAPVR